MTEYGVQVEYFPDTGEPVPAVCTSREACRFLRLDDERDETAALRALRRLVERKLLTPCRIGKENRFSRAAMLDFVQRATDLNGES